MSPTSPRQLPGTIGICANDTARYTAFAASLATLESPGGTQIAWAVGSDIAEGRELIVRDRMHGDWIWFIDDDHAFTPDILWRLLDWNVDVVGPIYLMRQQPFSPVTLIDEGKAIDLSAVPMEGLAEVYATGTAGLLVRRRVFNKIQGMWPDEPIFEKRMGSSDDYLFCEKLRELHIPIHVDLGQRLGHITSAVIWPDVLNDEEQSRVVTFQLSDTFTVSVGYETGSDGREPG